MASHRACRTARTKQLEAGLVANSEGRPQPTWASRQARVPVASWRGPRPYWTARCCASGLRAKGATNRPASQPGAVVTPHHPLCSAFLRGWAPRGRHRSGRLAGQGYVPSPRARKVPTWKRDASRARQDAMLSLPVRPAWPWLPACSSLRCELVLRASQARERVVRLAPRLQAASRPSFLSRLLACP
ncbi:uncharacterized protein PFL1_01675 [Pseudozyma flocculosa PF-1]|uniref:uncharacterized protein n=1 Tax=Pseudozyma flocculosa PF-1 TaxID=1277687 RepID=UPI0004560D17|nr:uncharacterized protein PFL1_01675 [Pseudozyma flocculosa PF-1]EPQ30774.1 hypothetical protein PFL1_01675 [Pseudozyma flocculosa PF-1]